MENSFSLGEILNTSKDSIINAYNNYKKDKAKHLILPTNNSAWVINDIYYYDTFLKIENTEVIEYKNIDDIFYNAYSETRGFITTRQTVFAIGYIDESDKENKEKGLVLVDGRIGKKEYERVSILNNLISSASFETRYNIYKQSLKENGYFFYMGYTFYSDGKVVNKNGKEVVNLKEVSLKDVSFSSNWSGAKSSSYNPFEFKISNGLPEISLLYGLIETGYKFKISSYEDNDIFNLLMYSFITNKKYPY